MAARVLFSGTRQGDRACFYGPPVIMWLWCSEEVDRAPSTYPIPALELRSIRQAWVKGVPLSALQATASDPLRSPFAPAGWDDHQLWMERIRNYRAKPIDVQIRRSFDGHVILRSTLNPTLYDYRSPQIAAHARPGQTVDLSYELVYRRGYNKKQNDVTLETIDVSDGSQQHVKYVPIGQEIELNLGSDPEVIHEWVCRRSWRDGFWFKRHALNVYFSPGQGHRRHPRRS